MVTDIFDSVNFSLNENHVIGCREDYDRANAALADFLLFYEQPLELTFPQLFDGYFAVSGEDAQKRRNMLLTLIGEKRQQQEDIILIRKNKIMDVTR